MRRMDLEEAALAVMGNTQAAPDGFYVGKRLALEGKPLPVGAACSMRSGYAAGGGRLEPVLCWASAFRKEVCD